MSVKRVIEAYLVVVLSIGSAWAAGSDVADAVQKRNKDVVRTLLQKKADVNTPQVDGATALHWAARWDDLETADLLIRAGANVKAANRAGSTPLALATINGNAAMIEKLLKAGADANAPVTESGDTPLMMAARTGKVDAIKVLLDNGAQINTKEKWGDTTALMWAVSEGHTDAAKLLIDRGADVNARTKIVPTRKGGGQLGNAPRDAKPNEAPAPTTNGGLTPLIFAARQGDLPTAKLLVAAGANVNQFAGDGKAALQVAVFNGNYELASFLIDSKADVNRADAEGYTALFWATDRRTMEFNPNIPWVVTMDPLPLIEKLLNAGADPNARINNTPTSRRSIGGNPRIKFGTALTRAAFSADLQLIKVLLAHGADANISSSDHVTALNAASGYGFIDSYSVGKSMTERLEVIKLLVSLGADVNEGSDVGITPLHAAAHLANLEIIQFLVDNGADLSAHDVGKGNIQSTEPLMPIDYAIGVTTFQPNAIVNRPQAEALMRKLMIERGIKHTTSECTLRGFTCGDIDPKVASPAQISTLRARQTGNQVEGITGGLGIKK